MGSSYMTSDDPEDDDDDAIRFFATGRGRGRGRGRDLGGGDTFVCTGDAAVPLWIPATKQLHHNYIMLNKCA